MQAHTTTMTTACGHATGHDGTYAHDVHVDESYVNTMLKRGKRQRCFKEYEVTDFHAYDYEGYRYIIAILRRQDAVPVEVMVAYDKGE